MLTLLIAALPAFAIPSTGDYTCSDFSVPYGADDACDCVFESDWSDWNQPGEGYSTDPIGTCFEMTANVNSVVSSARSTWYTRVKSAGLYYGCTTGRQLTSTATWSGGFPWVTGQVITSMEEGESCGVGVGIGTLRDIWHDEETGGWTIFDVETEVVIAGLAPREDGLRPLRIWEFDDDNDEAPDLVIYYEDGVIWTAPVPLEYTDIIEAPTNTPEDQDQDQDEDDDGSGDSSEDDERR